MDIYSVENGWHRGNKMAGIFKAYDIRGIVGEQLNADLCYKIARAFAIELNLRGKTVLVGHDMRKSGPEFKEAAIKGLLDEGANVVEAGLVSSPLFYFAAKEYDAGMMVTASHNPTEYNGFKLTKEKAIPVSFETGIDKIEAKVDSLPNVNGERGSVSEKNFLDTFMEFCMRFLQTKKNFKVVVDAANGMGGYTYTELQKRVGQRVEIIPMYFELDDTFPNHEANPLKFETMDDLKKKVVEVGADLGIAIDGDGDRCFFVDETGEHLAGDIFTAVIAQYLLKKEPGAMIGYDIRSSRAVNKVISDLGGKSSVTRVGHTLIKAQARKEGFLFAGEVSGHYYPKECNYCENTIYTFFQLLNLMDESGKKLSELAAPLRMFVNSGEINTKVEDQDGRIAAWKEKYGSRDDVISVSDIDGVRIDFADWWGLIRKSNTEPLLRLIVEAKSKELMEEKRDELLELIKS